VPPESAQRIGVLEAQDAPLSQAERQGNAHPSGRRLRDVRRTSRCGLAPLTMS
jgi:hypothetical protein